MAPPLASKNNYIYIYIYTYIHTHSHDMYVKTEIDSLIANINISNYYNETEIDDIDHELSTFLLDTYTKSEVDTFLTYY